MNSLTDGVSRIGPHPAKHSEAEARAAKSMRDRALALLTVLPECPCEMCQLKRELSTCVEALPLFEDKP